MGEVYRARDTKLNRDVAIKVLLPAVANDADRLARFRREAQVLASLNHPNIAHIHGLEEANGVTALILELVDGEDLAQRIARGPIPVDEALPIARQIAEALAAAHDHGIIHRDLKPANVKVRPDGTVKVLDFGLAKAIETGTGNREPRSADPMNSPTLSNHATQAGIILGTAAYMSPEQAAGKTVDKRTDLWAFGVVLMEMLTGRQVFKGETVSHIIAAVLKDDPDWTALPSSTPASVRTLLRRCLEKDRKRRLADASDARLEIEDAIVGSEVAIVTAGSSVASRWALAIAATVAALSIGTAMWLVRSSSGPASATEVVRFSIHDTDDVIISRGEHEMALSPDGRLLAFVGFGDGGARIWLRALGESQARPLPGTEGAAALCWSPDGRSVAFSALGQIKTLAVAGGAPRTIAPTGPTNLAWGRDGRIVWAGVRAKWHRVDAAGGELEGVVQADPGESYSSVELLPDGRHLLIAVASSDPMKVGTFVAGLDGGTPARVLPFATTVRYSMEHLLFVRDRVLYAQRFDLERLKLEGEPVLLAESVAPVFSVSDRGAVVYLPLTPSQEAAPTRLAWIERSGRVAATIDQAAGATRPALSPDNRRLAMVLRGDIWILELQRGVLSRVTSGRAADPTWLPDSQRMIFRRTNFRDGKDVIFTIVTGGVDKESLVFEPANGANLHAHVTDVSPDGRYMTYDTFDPAHLFVRALAGDPMVTAHGEGSGAQTQGMFSPDGRRLAYTSNSSGRFEVYVDGVPEPGTRIQVSANGGSSARWRQDGREMFYVAPDGTLTAVPVQSLQPLEFGPPVALFQFFSSIRGAPAGIPSYDVTPDGQRFIVSSIVRRTDPSIQVLLNWPALMTAQTTP